MEPEMDDRSLARKSYDCKRMVSMLMIGSRTGSKRSILAGTKGWPPEAGPVSGQSCQVAQRL